MRLICESIVGFCDLFERAFHYFIVMSMAAALKLPKAIWAALCDSAPAVMPASRRPVRTGTAKGLKEAQVR